MTLPNGRFWPRLLAALLLLLLPSCRDRLVAPPTPEVVPADTGMKVLGLVHVTISADGDGGSTATATSQGLDGPSLALTLPVGGDGTLQVEAISSGSFTEGTRNVDGQRYFIATFRVRNAQSNGAAYVTPRNNLTFLGASTASSLGGSAVTAVRKFDNTAASAAVAPLVTPTGSVVLDDSAKMKSNIPDVLQVLTEAEAAAVPLRPGVLGVFPWGFMVRNPNSPNSRTLPANPAANQWDGLVTFAFRVPLQPTLAQDVYSVSFSFLALDDSETRVTESIEEQDTASSNRARARAVALGATTTTVLNGSPAASPFVTDYPGQRQVCGVRVAGPAGGPTRTINADGAYVRLAHYYPGESLDSCAANFRSGTPARPSLTVPFPITVRAMDRYGNVRTTSADTITLTTTDGSASAISLPTALASGVATLNVTFNSYGSFTDLTRGRRRAGAHPVSVSGATRTWTGNTSTSWTDGTNWNPVGGAPGAQDTALVPGDRPNYPLLVQNTTIGGVTMTDGASVQPFVNVSAFDFTLNASMAQGNNGQITGTGRVILAGTSGTVGGGLSNVSYRNLRVTGSYSASSNLNVTGGRIVVQGGRLRSTSFRVRVRPS